jgi:hypothetical protein
VFRPICTHPDLTLASNQGQIGSAKYALLQDKDIPYADEQSNRTDLIHELKLLAWGKFFLGTFFERAHTLGVSPIPGMSIVKNASKAHLTWLRRNTLECRWRICRYTS